jgi:DNA repair protein RadC
MKPKKRTTLDIPACHEVQIHYRRPIYDLQKQISSSEKTVKVLRSFVDEDRIDHKEFFWVILLTNANQIVGISEVAVGTTNGVAVNIKEICQLAILTNASGMIVSHNHPSGKLKPSESDKNITIKLKKVLDLIDVHLLDHIILTSEGYTSFADNHLM